MKILQLCFPPLFTEEMCFFHSAIINWTFTSNVHHVKRYSACSSADRWFVSVCVHGSVALADVWNLCGIWLAQKESKLASKNCCHSQQDTTPLKVAHNLRCPWRSLCCLKCEFQIKSKFPFPISHACSQVRCSTHSLASNQVLSAMTHNWFLPTNSHA